jgi:type I restriction enzyme S subunit
MREDWEKCSLGDLLTLKNGFAFKSSKYITEGIPVIRIGDINDWIVDESQAKCIAEDEEYDGYIVEKGDILIAMSGATTGKFGIYESDRKAYQNQRVGNLKPSSDTLIDKKYIFNLLYSLKFQIEKDAYGGAQPNISAGKIHALNIVLAPLPEQHAIVAKIEEVFSDLDKGIADLNKAQDQLKLYRQAVLKKAFEGELTKEWREQQTDLPTADELLDQIKAERQKHYEQQIEDWKQAVKTWEEKGKEGKKPAKPQKHKDVDALNKNELDELASLPTNWKWIKNNELMFYVTSGSRDWKKFYSDTKGTYFVRTGDIKTNKLDLDGAAFVDLPKNVEGKRSLIEKGDLLMTITGANVGKIAHVDFEISEAYVSQSVALLKYVLKSFSPYLHYYFQSSATGAKFIGAMVYGVGRPVLSLDNMRDAPVSVCSFEEQHQIVQEIESRLSVCDKVEENITESLEKSKSLRQSILKKAFEGTLLSEEEITACKAAPDYEPASVLLEKIKAEKKKK